ncbi:MAG: hypothetical protein FWE98_02440 [Oscillospiraceae bacterium]|nr:hypothetical protein [Oscillospiraceae bacterium]
MALEVFRSFGGEACAVTVRERVGGESVEWQFQLERPLQLVMAFLNGEPEALGELTEVQQRWLREGFSGGGGDLLRDMAVHVLVCAEERGHDPIARLAAYSFSHEMFDLSRVASYAARFTLETSVVGTREMGRMSAGWSTLLEEYKAQPLPRREALFEALAEDARQKGHPFELSMAAEYATLSQLLKSLVIEMIQTRALLKRCLGCGRHYPANEACVCGR